MLSETILVASMLFGYMAAPKGGIIDDPVVGEISIFAFSSEAPPVLNVDGESTLGIGTLSGHVFLQVKNTSGSTFLLGHRYLANNETITLSCWESMNGFNHSGLWYNRESFDMCGWEILGHNSLTSSITQLGIDTISTYMTTQANNYYSLFNHTCANVSVHLWNSVILDLSMMLSVSIGANLPFFVRQAISAKTSNSSTLYYSSSSYCGYVDSYGCFTMW